MDNHHHIKKLYRNKTDKMVAGVLSGIGDYFGIDATIVRVIFVITDLVTGVLPFAFLYLVLAVIVPEKKHEKSSDDEAKETMY